MNTDSFMKALTSSPTATGTPRKDRPTRKVSSTLGVQLNQLAQQLGVSLKELAPLLQISESTLHRFRRQKELKDTTAERVELLQGIIQHGLRVYDGDVHAFQGWLRYALGELDGKTPLQSLTTVAGFTQVDDILGRIEHGIFF